VEWRAITQNSVGQARESKGSLADGGRSGKCICSGLGEITAGAIWNGGKFVAKRIFRAGAAALCSRKGRGALMAQRNNQAVRRAQARGQQ